MREVLVLPRTTEGVVGVREVDTTGRLIGRHESARRVVLSTDLTLQGDNRHGTARLVACFPQPWRRLISITDPPSLKVGDLPLTLTRTKGWRLKDRRLIFEGTGFMWSLACGRLGGDVTVRDSNDQIVLQSRGLCKRRSAHRMFVADTLNDDELALAVLIVTFNIYKELSHFLRWANHL